MNDLGRTIGPDGNELILRQDKGGFILLSDGKVAIASADRRSERELVNLALGPLRDRNDVTVLLGGLGMGYTLRALLSDPRVVRVDVVEQLTTLIEWHQTHLSVLHDEPPLLDERVHVHNVEFGAFLRSLRYGAVQDLPPGGRGFLGLVLDLDDGPSGLSRGQNASLYSDEGLGDLEEALCPGGVLALWSAQREPELLSAMRGRFQNVAEIVVPVDIPGLPQHNLDYVYRCRRSKPAVIAAAGKSGGNGHSPYQA